MAATLSESNQYGASFVWGGPTSTDAPTITGFAARAAQIEYTPEVDDTATDAEGHVEGRVVSKPANRAATVTLTGYVSDATNFPTVADFTWNGRFWVIQSVGFNRDKGKYAEATIKATSNTKITGPSA